MRPTDLALNQTPGIADDPPGAEHLLELPLSPLGCNQLGSIHAAPRFIRADASSRERLPRDYAGQTRTGPLVGVRGAWVKYRRAATGSFRAHARADNSTAHHPSPDLATRSRTGATVPGKLKDHVRHLVLAGTFRWSVGGPGQPVV